MMFISNKTYWVIFLALVVIILPIDAYAAFDGLKSAGKEIFTGLRDIIYPASAIGIITICICGAFGTINWKWMMAIIIGLIVISLCQGFIALFVGSGNVGDIPNNIALGN